MNDERFQRAVTLDSKGPLCYNEGTSDKNMRTLRLLQLANDYDTDPKILMMLADYEYCPIPVLVELSHNPHLPSEGCGKVYLKLKPVNAAKFGFERNYFVKHILNNPNCPEWISEFESLNNKTGRG